MKKILFISVLILLASCAVKKYYIDVPYANSDIFRIHPFEWFSCENCQENYDNHLTDYIENNKITWIPFSKDKYTDNGFLLNLHNTLKSISYSNLISNDFYNQNIEGFIDSLLIYENQEIDTSNYYSMFLYRREIQGTRGTVVTIVKEIKKEFKGETVSIDTTFVNDTIVQLVRLDSKLKQSDTIKKKELLLQILDYLKSINQYHLAYQIINRPIDFSSYGISKDSIILTFPIDTVKEFRYSDTTMRLGNFDKNGVWTDSYLWWKDYPGP